MSDSAPPTVRDSSIPADDVLALEQRPSIPTFGSWGLAELSATKSNGGRRRLVGRELESFRLLHVFASTAREKVPTVVTISGPSGMGKTRLIEDALGLALLSGFGGRIFSVRASRGDES